MMNESNYNLEQQIKKQIEAREINPTRDLWSEIEIQKENTQPVKSKLNWFLVAACFFLVASLSAVLFFNKEQKTEAQIVETQIQPRNNSVEKIPLVNSTPLKSEQKEIFKTENNRIVSAQKTDKKKQILVPEKPLIPSKKEVEDKLNRSPIENISSNYPILASTDSVKSPKKRKKYVDASTLLFSVEHKDVIENSKEGSNVATIDLNSK